MGWLRTTGIPPRPPRSGPAAHPGGPPRRGRPSGAAPHALPEQNRAGDLEIGECVCLEGAPRQRPQGVADHQRPQDLWILLLVVGPGQAHGVVVSDIADVDPPSLFDFSDIVVTGLAVLAGHGAALAL